VVIVMADGFLIRPWGMSKGFEIAEPTKPNDSFAGSRDLWRAYTMRRGAARTIQ
jgi:hypothetical protein